VCCRLQVIRARITQVSSMFSYWSLQLYVTISDKMCSTMLDCEFVSDGMGSNLSL